MPLYDTECVGCKKIYIDVWLKMDETPPLCEDCGQETVRLCNCSHFKLLYDPKKDTVGWSWDGYASTQYWSQVKKLRSEGHDVKACNEN